MVSCLQNQGCHTHHDDDGCPNAARIHRPSHIPPTAGTPSVEPSSSTAIPRTDALMLLDLHLLDDDTFSDEEDLAPPQHGAPSSQPLPPSPPPRGSPPAPTFPVTFFESAVNVSSEVVLGGDLQSVGGPERAAALLGEVEGYVEAATPVGMNLTMRCVAAGMAVVGVKLHVGGTGRGKVPRGVVVRGGCCGRGVDDGPLLMNCLVLLLLTNC